MHRPFFRLVIATTLAIGAGAWAGGAQADGQGFAVEIAPPADPWSELRLGLRLFGETAEPAAGYVRGCAGHVPAEAAGAQLDVTAPLELLTLTVADEDVAAMVLGTPDGLFRCVLPGADGLLAARLPGAEAGRYRIWLAAPEPGRIDARLIVADRPVSGIELRGLDIAALDPPRAGQHVFTPEGARQVLAAGATLFPEEPMAPLSALVAQGAERCVGFGRFDAADATLSVTENLPALSLFATSERDLTIAVRGPDGRILCNDDSSGLDPAVTFAPAGPGDYHIFVGGFSSGGSAVYDLFASAGSPSWDGREPTPEGPPRMGMIAFDRDDAGHEGQLLARGALVPDQPMADLTGLGFCPGFTGLDAPDAVMTMDRPEAMISLYALSQVDLVLAVRAPDGQWYCNDDSFGLNPGISIQQAPAGDYAIWVGAYHRGEQGGYNLYAALGEPAWEAADRGQNAALNAEAEPSVGRIGFGPGTLIDPRVIFDVAPSGFDARGMGPDCIGFITPDQPDLVIETEFGLPQLMVYMVSEADGVLLIVGPDGSIHCNDDFEGLHPGVMIPNPQPGPWAVFAGTYGGSGGMATLGVTIASPRWVMDREH